MELLGGVPTMAWLKFVARYIVLNVLIVVLLVLSVRYRTIYTYDPYYFSANALTIHPPPTTTRTIVHYHHHQYVNSMMGSQWDTTTTILPAETSRVQRQPAPEGTNKLQCTTTHPNISLEFDENERCRIHDLDAFVTQHHHG